MNAAGAIFIVSVGITSAYFLFLSLKTDERQEQKRTDTIMRLLSGEVIDVYDDKETGLSVIAIRDKDGITQYGFSRLPVKELETLYAGKGCVQVPVMGKKDV